MLGVYVSRKGGKYGLLAAIQYYIKCRYEVNVEPRAIRQALKEAEELRKTF